MVSEILRHTPTWVFVLFFVLWAFGYLLSKDRTVGRGQLYVLPAAMIVLSAYGVYSAFGLAPVGLAAWLAGSAAAVGLCSVLGAPRGVSYSDKTRLFSVPGSWLPLALMMVIFFIKYAVGVIQARQLSIAGEPVFIGSISLCYGLLSGVFLARALMMLRAARRTAPAAS